MAWLSDAVAAAGLVIFIGLAFALAGIAPSII
jgi:hypothetical protein